MKYAAILSNGGKLTVELPEGAGNELTIRDGRYLLDLTGIVLNTAHVAALVPLPDESEKPERRPEEQSEELPVGLIDAEGDFWHRQDDGRYSLTPDGTRKPHSREYIAERYGIREIID